MIDSKQTAIFSPPNILTELVRKRSNLVASIIISLAGIFWLWYSGTHELLQDEAYYWQWSRHLAVGYFDNTPMMAWLIALFAHIFGNNELGVRFGAVISSCISAWAIYHLAKRLFGAPTALLSIILILITPLFGAGAFIMTADPPQVAFWSITAYIAWLAITSDPKTGRSWGLWLMSGLFAGMAAMSKVNGLFVLSSVALFLLIEPTQRKWLTQPQPYVSAALALLIFSPFIWWNHTHGDAFWLHINHMSSRSESGITLKYFGDYLGGQAALISPLLFLTYLWILANTLRSSNISPEKRYCWSLTAFVFLETMLVSFKSRVEGNWAVTAYVTGIILLAQFVIEQWQNSRWRIWHRIAISLAILMTAGIYITTLTSAQPRINFLDKRTDELYGWKDMAERVEQEKNAMGGNPFIFGINYRMPSELAFYLPGHPQTYCLMLDDRGNQYEFWENANLLVGRNALMINDDKSPDHLEDARQVFSRVEVEPSLSIYRAGIAQPIRYIQIFRCYGFKGYSREKWQNGY